jgi:glutathione S-transferase
VSQTRLLTIGPSHYCEKARWALDYVHLPFVEECHLPMKHWVYTRRYGRTVPVLLHEGAVYNDSTAILRFADQLAAARGKPGLYDAAGAALALEEKFDADLGPPVRRFAYCHLAPRPDLLMQVFSPQASAGEERFLRLGGARVMGVALGRAFRVSARAASRSAEKIERVFDGVAEQLAKATSPDEPFLVGARFSAADLSFTALALPVLAHALAARGLRAPGYALPLAALPDGYRALAERLADHPAGAHALKMYAAYR